MVAISERRLRHGEMSKRGFLQIAEEGKLQGGD